MKTWILPAIMTAIAGVLVMGVLRPDAAREVVAVPKAWIEARRTTALKTRTRAEWSDITRRSADGDADAMYRLGRKMSVWSNETWTGVPTDAERGEELIRRAAEAGHIDARLAVWQVDGRDAASLVTIADDVGDRNADIRELGRLTDWLRWTALQQCHDGVRNAAIRLYESIYSVETAIPRRQKRFVSFMAEYDRRCAQ